MKKYALLSNPGHNRVYFEESKKLSISELKLALTKISCTCSEIEGVNISEVYYVTFQAETGISEEDISIISKLSFVYAIFEIVTFEETEYLRPISRANYEYLSSNISTILKYTGKTNEIFTRMLINIAVFSTDAKDDKIIKLLDPLAGKGTTLYEGLIRGYDVCGIEIGEKVVTEAYHFMKRYLETEHLKHTSRIERMSGPKKIFTSKRYNFEIAKTKEDFKQFQTKHFEIIAGNSKYADVYYKKDYFDIIVSDLPYGVQHGSVTNEKQTSLTRNPTELLQMCLGSWYNVLKSNGVIVLAWNSLMIPREQIVEILKEAGFSVFKEEIYSEFEHRVDQSIKRDIITAKKII